MNIRKIWNNTAILAAVMLFCLPGSLLAVPILWDISFEDHSGAQVGGGVFSFDPATETPVVEGPYYETKFTVSTAIDYLDWTVQDVHWTSAHRDTPREVTRWWRDELGEQHPPGHDYIPDHAWPMVTTGVWSFGDPAFSRGMEFHFEHSDSTSGSGSWSQYALISGDQQNGGYLEGWGSWIAVARAPVVPIPPTAPLFAIGLAGLVWLERKRRRAGTR